MAKVGAQHHTHKLRVIQHTAGVPVCCCR
jgi:hypothetical protein